LLGSTTLPAARSEKRAVRRLSSERCWSRTEASEMAGCTPDGLRRRSQGSRIKSD